MPYLQFGCLTTFLMWKKKWDSVKIKVLTYCKKVGMSISQATVTWFSTHPWGCIESTWIYFTFEHMLITCFFVKKWIIRYDVLINNTNVLSQLLYIILFLKWGRIWVKFGKGGLWFARGETCIYCFNSRPLISLDIVLLPFLGLIMKVKQRNVSCINLYDQDFYCYFQINNPAVIFREMKRYLKCIF